MGQIDEQWDNNREQNMLDDPVGGSGAGSSGREREAGVAEEAPGGSDGGSFDLPDAKIPDGKLDIRDDGVSFTPTGGADTVSGQLQGLLASNSDYIKNAQANAMETANQRGLLNSTMAASAGTKAAIGSALPIAQQDAAYRQESTLQQEQGGIQQGLYETQGRLASDLSAQESEQQSRLQQEKGQIEQDLAAQGFEYDKTLKDIDVNWNQMELDAKMQFSYDQLNADQKQAFDATAGDIGTQYMDDYLAILVDPNFATHADRLAAIEVLNETTKDRYAIAASISGVELD